MAEVKTYSKQMVLSGDLNRHGTLFVGKDGWIFRIKYE